MTDPGTEAGQAVAWIPIRGSDDSMDDVEGSVSRWSVVHLATGPEVGGRVPLACGRQSALTENTWGGFRYGRAEIPVSFSGRSSRKNPSGRRHLKRCSRCFPTSPQPAS